MGASGNSSAEFNSCRSVLTINVCCPTVIAFENKNIKTAADLWISEENAENFVLWPEHKENRPVELKNAIINHEKPRANWVKKKCFILQSQFDSFAKAKAAEKKIKEARKSPEIYRNAPAEQYMPPELDPDHSEIVREINSLTFTEFDAPDSRSEQTKLVDFIEAETTQRGRKEIDRHEKTVPLALAQAVFDEYIPEVEPEAVLEAADPELRYEFPIVRKKHIKYWNTILRSQAILSQKAVEQHAECYPTTNYKEMVRVVASKILSDSFLKKYSYCGRGNKKELRKYSNVVELIIQTTMIHYPAVAYNDILKYFKDEYIKYAERRFLRGQ